MDPRTMKTFQLIVELGSFNRAAEALNYAQSTVTMQIQKLESELGVALFARGKTIALTDAGRWYYEQSIPVVRQLEDLRSRLADFRAGEAGQLRIGANEPLASCRLPSLLSRFQSRYPKIDVSVAVANTPVLSERLLRGELDFAICSAPELGANLFFEPLFTETFALLVPERHPLDGRADVRLADLADHRLLITASNCPYRRKLEFLLHRADQAQPATMEVSSMTALPSYVASGLGVALVPRILLAPPPSGTRIADLRDAAIDLPIGLLSRVSEHPLLPSAAKLYDHLKQGLKETVPA
ncbi:LysR family transcriptional regulator [Cohnella nanjingensis]|uniref:LysR family transcriptional regulator n=1 Tax=Cohnella nanjingensis TaxID=1387779 RepID=A0A7X0RWS8_9BACL|nr:LysR family transcriptional regulator [Cohnella nanjingensis]MBB6675134.1 LysR family transcriptional regulator [Cohnella nanjingensis]